MTIRLLLDTHALLWWLNLSNRLSVRARNAIAEQAADVLVSTISAFEITTKHRIGKLPDVEALITGFAAKMRAQRFGMLSISLEHALSAGSLKQAHRDPFDRLLAAQALVDDLTIVSIDDKLDQFGVRRLW